VLRHLALSDGLAFHHVRIELRRPANCLAGVADDEVQARMGGEQLPAEGFHARRVAQIQAEDFQPMTPLREVWFLSVALCRIARKTRGDDELRSASEQFQAGLVADFDTSSSEQGHAPAQVGEFGPLGEIELGAGRTHLVVEVMDDGVLLFAHVTVLRLDVFFRLFKILGRENIGSGENRFTAQLADASFVQNRIYTLRLRRATFAFRCFLPTPASNGVGIVGLSNG
jgi:hypothetical protein